MMIKQLLNELVIHGFRGLRELTLAELGRVNVLVGGNNSGKTSVLEALSCFCRPLDPLAWLETAELRQIRTSSRVLIEPLKWLFPQDIEGDKSVLAGGIYIQGKGDSFIKESRATYREWESAGEEEEEGKDTIIKLTRGLPAGGLPAGSLPVYKPMIRRRRGADLELQALVRLKQPTLFSGDLETIKRTFQITENERFVRYHDDVSEYQLPIDTITPASYRFERQQIAAFTETRFKELDQQEILRIIQAMDPLIEGVEILSSTGDLSQLYLQHKKVGLAPLNTFGDGVRQLLLIALTIPLVKDGILLIDELETAIHTSALSPAFKWLIQSCTRYNVQLFATTHSLEAVDALLDAARDVKRSNLNVYRLERTPERTQSVHIDADALTILREELGQEVR